MNIHIHLSKNPKEELPEIEETEKTATPETFDDDFDPDNATPDEIRGFAEDSSVRLAQLKAVLGVSIIASESGFDIPDIEGVDVVTIPKSAAEQLIEILTFTNTITQETLERIASEREDESENLD